MPRSSGAPGGRGRSGGTRERRRERRRLGLRQARGPRPDDLVAPADQDATIVNEVARGFVDAVEHGDLAGLLSFYDPDAVVHTPSGDLLTRRELESWWSRSDLWARPAPRLTEVEGHQFVLEWDRDGGSRIVASATVIDARVIEHDIVERLEAVMVPGPPLEVSSSGGISEAERAHARDMVWRLVDSRELELLDGSVRLEMSPDPAHPRPARARANLLVHATPLRASVTATTIDEAIDLLDGRLRHRLDHMAQHRRALRRRGPDHEPGQWRHGDRGDRAVPFRHPEPLLVHRSNWVPEGEDLDEAIWDLETMDWNFCLFRNVDGIASVVWRRDDGTYGLREAVRAPEVAPPLPDAVAAVTRDPRPFPMMSLDQARHRLDLEGRAWLAFVDEADGEPGVVYRRRDGHDGLVTLTPSGGSG